MTVTILGPVVGLDRAQVLGPCVLGQPGAGEVEPLVLGEGVVIRAFAVLYAGSVISREAQIGHGALIREGNHVGEGASIGTGVALEPGNRIGPRSRIHTGCFLSSTTIGADVFVGPRVTFTDDPHPPCPRYLECVGGAVVADRAAIGAGTTVLPGVAIGARALVGAGSVVVHDVPEDRVVAGNPARDRGRRDGLACGAGHFEAAYAWLDEPSVR